MMLELHLKCELISIEIRTNDAVWYRIIEMNAEKEQPSLRLDVVSVWWTPFCGRRTFQNNGKSGNRIEASKPENSFNIFFSFYLFGKINQPSVDLFDIFFSLFYWLTLLKLLNFQWISSNFLHSVGIFLYFTEQFNLIRIPSTCFWSCCRRRRFCSSFDSNKHIVIVNNFVVNAIGELFQQQHESKWYPHNFSINLSPPKKNANHMSVSVYVSKQRAKSGASFSFGVFRSLEKLIF